MLITLNGSPLDIDGIEENVKVFELVQLVENELKGSNATVMRIFLDGQEFTADNPKLAELQLMAYEKAELVASSAADVVREAFADSTEILLHLEDVAGKVASELRLGKVNSAMQKYVELVDGLAWFVTVINDTEKAYAGKMAESSYEAERQELVAKSKEQFKEALKAQENKDWVGVADIVEYEYCEIFRNARALIAKLMKD